MSCEISRRSPSAVRHRPQELYSLNPNVGTDICENSNFKKEIGEILLSACDWKSRDAINRVSIKNLHIYLRFIIYIEYRDLSLFTSRMLPWKTEISSDGDKYRIFILLITTYSILTSIPIAERQRKMALNVVLRRERMNSRFSTGVNSRIAEEYCLWT